MSFIEVMSWGQGILLITLRIIAGVASLAALIHAALQRADAFPAVDRQTKLTWVLILIAATAVIWLFGPVNFLGIIGVVAMLVYLVDVRHRVDEIQGRHWFRRQR